MKIKIIIQFVYKNEYLENIICIWFTISYIYFYYYYLFIISIH
jgi:hypothetical protein